MMAIEGALMEVHLVADTNLFFECKALEELPWSELGYDPVVILLTKPVLNEIDKHKNGSGRTRKRALEIFQRVRGMLESSAQEVEIQASSPRVVLRRTPPSVAPDPAHKDHLDYAKTDERLIGIASTLSTQASGYNVRLFTDDTGPASTADGMGVSYLMINESWRRPASETTEEKKIKDLEKDLATYRAQEPKIAIGRCKPADESNVVEVVRRVATPLTEAEVEGFLAKLRLKHPLVTDFMPPPSSTMTDFFGTTTMTEYSAPAEADIAKYRDVLYPQWLEQCGTALKGLHQGRDEFESDIVLRWSMANKGSRPASKVRVVFETQGPLALRRLHREDEDAEDAEDARGDASPHGAAGARSRFPPAPRPPAFLKNVTRVPALAAHMPGQGFDLASLRAAGAIGGQYKVLAEASKSLRLAGQLPFSNLGVLSAEAARLMQTASIFNSVRGLDQAVQRSLLRREADYLDQIRLPQMPSPPEPESFYYDDWPTMRPVTKGTLTCDLWRHQADEETFEFEALFTKDGEARGIVECTVHAENLTTPKQAKVIVSRSIEPLSMVELAEAMVEDCK